MPETGSAETAGKTVIVIVRWGPPAPILLHFSGFTDRIRKDKKGRCAMKKQWVSVVAEWEMLATLIGMEEYIPPLCGIVENTSSKMGYEIEKVVVRHDRDPAKIVIELEVRKLNLWKLGQKETVVITKENPQTLKIAKDSRGKMVFLTL